MNTVYRPAAEPTVAGEIPIVTGGPAGYWRQSPSLVEVF